jgi:peptidoglycan/xylan/chitin deacetylase (PgdA/CDA1 family)
MNRRPAGLFQRLARPIQRRFERKAVVLMYHRVAELTADPWAIGVTPGNFAEHLAVLRAYARPTSLRQLVRGMDDDRVAPRTVVVTFDDGYADNLQHAKPLLERYDIPATMFLTTGALGSGREYWWDELERLLLQPGVLPEMLELEIGGQTLRWELGEGARYTHADARRCGGWRAWQAAPGTRHALYRSLWQLLHSLGERQRSRALEALHAWAGGAREMRPIYRAMTRAEVPALAQGGLIEVGAHTVTHPSLASLPAAAQQVEIQHSKECLEELVAAPVVSFSYPFGQRSDYTPETVGMVQAAGFACACSNFGGVVTHASDRFQLPRAHVQDWNGDAFGAQLRKWMDE